MSKSVISLIIVFPKMESNDLTHQTKNNEKNLDIWKDIDHADIYSRLTNLIKILNLTKLKESKFGKPDLIKTHF